MRLARRALGGGAVGAGWRAALAIVASLALATCLGESTGLQPGNASLSIEGDTAVRVAETVTVHARIAGVTDLGSTLVTWSSSDQAIAVVDPLGPTTTVHGVKPGAATITVSVAAPDLSQPLSHSRQVVVIPGLPHGVGIVTAPSSAAQAGDSLAQQPVIQLLDASGYATTPTAPGQSVTAVLVGDTAARLSGASAAVGASGEARFAALTISGPTGLYLLKFRTGGLDSVYSSAITLGPGSPRALALAAQPSTAAQSGVAFSRQPSVQLRDAFGNAVGQAGVVVTAAIGTGTGTLGGTVVVNTGATGAASFGDLVLVGAPGTLTLVFTAPGVAGVTSNPIALTFGPAARLAFAVQPSAVVAGASIAPAVGVSVRDTTGNVVASATDSITLALGADAGAGVLGGTIRMAAVAGVAVFADLVLDKAGAGYTLVASAGGLTSATSVPFDVAAAAAAQIAALSATSQTGTVGTPVEARPSVRVTDAYGNGVPGVIVTFARQPGGAWRDSITGAVQTTDATGVATLGGWLLGTRVDWIDTVTATAAGSLGGNPVTFTVTRQPGPPSNITSRVSTTANTVEVGQSVVVVLHTADMYGNWCTSGGAEVTFFENAFLGTFGVVADDGTGTYTATFTGQRVGWTMIFATINGLPPWPDVNPPTVHVIPGPAS